MSGTPKPRGRTTCCTLELGLPITCYLKVPWNADPCDAPAPVQEEIREALHALAFQHDDTTLRSERLFSRLRKMAGQPFAVEYLEAVMEHIVSGDAVGARLLAAFVAVSTPGERLLPRIQGFHSSRRIHGGIINSSQTPGNFHQDWLARLEQLVERCAPLLPTIEGGVAPEPVQGGAPPWQALRDGLDLLLARLSLKDQFSVEERQLLVELLRLEVDAWQERISNLAGTIDPFRVAAVQRILPILNQADAEIRDLRQMIAWIEEGTQGQPYDQPVARAFDILDEGDRKSLGKSLAASAVLDPLRKLFLGLADHPVPVPDLAYGIECLQAVGRLLAAGDEAVLPPGLLEATAVLQEHYEKGRFSLPVDAGFAAVLQPLIKPAAANAGEAELAISGLTFADGSLVIAIPEGGAFPAHDFPAAEDLDELDGAKGKAPDPVADHENEDEEFDPTTATASELKKLVLGNIMAVSVLLGFLRNPKVTAVPGLVEDVVTRTRNSVVIETVAKVRILHTGFANRGVALACLRSPVNVPVAVLRKFIHVKYVSKTDLKRLALDKGGIRKEVGREIAKYLVSLS